ncbi:ankyrin repeat domain-containing protein 50 [Coprinopsis cinerea AmutBmut pab1-1]|nr:ankyrin repeat domain-containing protein 50 [Coprinopsis cinerea AmutBmut pab1-1]
MSQADPSTLPEETIQFAHRMFDAARNGNSELLLAAIDAGLPANLTNDKGNTLLMLAAYAGHATLARELLQRGADPNRLNDLGQSIIAGAVFKGHTEVVTALAEHNADPRAGKPNALQAAHMFRRSDLFKLLGGTDADITEDVPVPLPQSN